MSFTVTAGSPQSEASFWKDMKFIWSSYHEPAPFKLPGPSGSAAHSCKGESVPHTFTHSRT